MNKTSAIMIWLFNDIKQASILDFNKLLNEVKLVKDQKKPIATRPFGRKKSK